MTLTRPNFLFLAIFLPFSILFSVQTSFAQLDKDSLAYFSEMALKPKSPNHLDEAYRYFESEYTVAMAQSKISIAIHRLYYLSSIDYKKGAYEASEETSVKALALLDNYPTVENNLSFRKSFYNLLAMLYYEQRNSVKSLELYDKVLAITEQAKDSAIVYNNISNVYNTMEAPKKANEALIKAFEITPRLKDTLTRALIFDNLGFSYAKLGSHEQGINLMETALQLRAAVQDTSTLYKSYSHLANFYLSLDSTERSKAYALKALDLAESINSPSYLRDALGVLTTLSPDDHAKAYKFLNDSLYQAEKAQLNSNALLKYDYAEYKRKALESQLNQERQAYKTIVAIAVAGFIALGSLMLYSFLRSKYKRNTLQEVYNSEARISKKVHDEVANDVYQVMTKLQSASDSNDALLDDLESIYIRTRDISKENSYVDLNENFNDILSDLLFSYNSDAVNVITKNASTIDWEVLSDLKKMSLYRVLQELMTNMRKHSQASLVVLNFKQTRKTISITYKDNGIGSDLIKHNGLQNAENRINAINGSLNFVSQNNKGFSAHINI